MKALGIVLLGITIAVIVDFVVLKWLWVTISTMGHGTFVGEKSSMNYCRPILCNRVLWLESENITTVPVGWVWTLILAQSFST